MARHRLEIIDVPVTFRDDVWMVPGASDAQRRVHNAGYAGVGAAWNSLGLFTSEDAKEYILPTLEAAARGDRELAERLVDSMLLFAITAVEADRERRRNDAEA